LWREVEGEQVRTSIPLLIGYLLPGDRPNVTDIATLRPASFCSKSPGLGALLLVEAGVMLKTLC